MLDAISEWVAEHLPETWIIGRGWNESFWSDPDIPTRTELDHATGRDRSCIFWRSDMHSALVNSAALEAASINKDTPNPEGGIIGRSSDGVPDGRLYELAINLVTPFIPEPNPLRVEEAYLEGMSFLHSLGVTALHSQRMKDQHEGPGSFQILQKLNEKKALKLRINHNIAAHDLKHVGALGLRSGFGDDYLRLGHVKLFTDGSLGSKTAWMLEPLEGIAAGAAQSHGINVTPMPEMAESIEEANRLGFPVSIHAIGDRANRELLDVFEELAQISPAPNMPNRIEHVQIIDPADIPRLAKLSITASVQPIHALDDMDIADSLLGQRSRRAYNFRSLIDSGALVAFGSDAPVANPNPFLGFHAAICRQRPNNMSAPPWHSEELLTLEQTIRAYTIDAALAGGWSEVIGSITPGKRADIIVLDRDLFSVDLESEPKAIAETRVLLTLFDGQIVYDER
jgi:hypothetical protein